MESIEYTEENNWGWTPPEQWVKFNPDLGATPGAADMTNRIQRALEAEGLDVASLHDAGQGAEKKKPRGLLKERLSYKSKPHTQYNSEILSPLATRKEAVGYVDRHLGVEATTDTLVVGRQLGRTMLWDANFIMLRPFFKKPDSPEMIDLRLQDPTVVGSDLGWGLIDGQYDQWEAEYKKFRMQEADIPSEIEEVVSSIDDKAYAGTNMVTIHNATGFHFTEQDLVQTFANQDERNKRRVEKGLHKAPIIIDHPYYAAHPRNQEIDAQTHLATGFNKVLKVDSYTPWVIILSLSKTFAQAQEGLTIVAASHEMAGQFKPIWKVNGHITGYSPRLMKNLAAVFSAAGDEDALAHMDLLRNDYELNRGLIEDLFPDRIVKSDLEGRNSNSMTSLLAFRPEEVLGKIVECHDGIERLIANADQLVEYLANQYGMVVVNNGFDDRGNIILRVAQALPHETFKTTAKRLEAGIKYVSNAPTANIALGQDYQVDPAEIVDLDRAPAGASYSTAPANDTLASVQRRGVDHAGRSVRHPVPAGPAGAD